MTAGWAYKSCYRSNTAHWFDTANLPGFYRCHLHEMAIILCSDEAIGFVGPLCEERPRLYCRKCSRKLAVAKAKEKP